MKIVCNVFCAPRTTPPLRSPPNLQNDHRLEFSKNFPSPFHRRCEPHKGKMVRVRFSALPMDMLQPTWPSFLRPLSPRHMRCTATAAIQDEARLFGRASFISAKRRTARPLMRRCSCVDATDIGILLLYIKGFVLLAMPPRDADCYGT